MRRPVVLALAVGFLALPGPSPAATLEGFELVGHHPLFARGMNAAPAVYGDHVYIGSRTDGSPEHPHPGVLVVDVSKPEEPEVEGEIAEAKVGETSRELRVWPQEKLLIVLNFGCSSLIHACKGGEARGSSIEFYDLTEPEEPELVSTYVPSRVPHEFFLWLDPLRSGRALLYMSTPTTSDTRPNLIVTDISEARDGTFSEIAKFNPNAEFSDEDRDRFDVRLHSMGVSDDGMRAYLAYLGGGFLVVDSSDVANAAPEPQLRLLTPVGQRVSWGDPGAHSAVEVPGRPLALVTDEVYGDMLDPITGFTHGCPWGWARIVDVVDPARPRVIGEYRIAQNDPSYCEQTDPADTTSTSYSSHNPTLIGDLALVSWHSGGLQAFSLADPAAPATTGVFSPDPLPFVFTEDPALSMGRNKVVAWSYPIVADGLIYLVDIRNGLYILRYTGAGAERVAAADFAEGNSNL